jgi:hypothetical protein
MTGPGRLSLLVASCALACTELTEPVALNLPAPPKPVAVVKAAPTAAPAPAPAPAPTPTAAPQPTGEMVAASHILIAYKGGMRAAEAITRSKDEAKARAAQIAARARKGEDFAKLADEASDDPSAKVNHGSLGKFTRDRMVKPFADAAFALKPGQISDLVETPFGYHVIKRTE